jgi:GT2 family glycosyltransferase
VIVVIDGGTGRDAQQIHEFEPKAELIQLPKNVGFTRAVSIGISRSSDEWVVVLNDDVVVDSNCLRLLLEAGESCRDIGSVAPQIRFYDPQEVINSAGLEIDRLGIAFDRFVGRRIEEAGDEVVDVFGVSAGAALYRRAMLDRLGGFDKSFIAYMEDADLAWRARMQGWRALYEPRAVVFHHHSATFEHGSPEKYFLVGRNRVRLLAKNATTLHLLRYGLGMFAYDLAYVTFVACRDRTVAPAYGRIAGLREWKHYRSKGQNQRSPVPLVPVKGLPAALRRSRTWGRRSLG